MREHHRETNEINPVFLKVLNSMNDLEEHIKKQVKNVVYVVLFPLDHSTKNVYIKLSKLKTCTVYIDWGAMPVYTNRMKSKKLDRFVGAFKSLGYFRLVIRSKKIFLLQKLNVIQKFDIVFASGKLLENKPRHAKRVVSLPFADYYEFKKVEKKPKIKTSRFVVFLDINLPFQTDLILEGMPQINPNTYYSELNSFFEIIEAEFKVEVVIAAHPKTSSNLNYFGHRAVKRMKTAELVRDAEFVISHQSTSISYAVLNYKPIIFFYTQAMKSLYTGSVIDEIINVAHYFGLNPINVNSESGLTKISVSQVDKGLYDQYIEEFITSKSSYYSVPSDVFISEIISLVNSDGIKK
jgi:hypothetical protein